MQREDISAHLSQADPAAAKPTTILVDLKPALDGYAGIPQESRLLFRGLSTLPGVRADGLIQHGARALGTGVEPENGSLSTSQQINRLSRAVVSLHAHTHTSPQEYLLNAIRRELGLLELRLKVLTRGAIKLGVFQSPLFADFIWRTLFSKTLAPEEKELVTGARYRLLRYPKKLLYQVGFSGWKPRGRATFPRIDTTGYDVFVAQTPFPGRVSPETQLVVRYHDAVPILMPHVIKDKSFHQGSHFYSLQENVRAGAWFACISEATRRDLLQIFPEAEPRSVVIHNIVSREYFREDTPKNLVFKVIGNRLARVKELQQQLPAADFGRVDNPGTDFQYLLAVSTIEPRKNQLLLLQAWEQLKYTSMPGLRLVLVGNLGWDHAEMVRAFGRWAERGELFLLSDVPAAELRVLYRHAAATICPSLSEGFDYSGVEAMRCGGMVISSDIPVHREVFADGSAYFDPYSAADAAQVIGRVLAPEGDALRGQLHARAEEVSARYTAERLLPQWESFLRRIAGGR